MTRVTGGRTTAKRGAGMRGTAKRDLPTKVCASCGQPFAWRKKWEKVWDEVKYCSDRCRRNRTAAPSGSEKSGDPIR